MTIRVQRVGLIVGCVALASCAALFGFEDLEDSRGADADVAAPSLPDGGDAGPSTPTCGLGTPPQNARPGDQSATFAVSRMDLVGADAPPDPILDIDCVDTQTPEQSSCVLPDGGASAPVYDGLGGADRTANALMRLVAVDGLGFERRLVSMVFDVSSMVAPPADTLAATLSARTAFHHVPADGEGCQPWPAVAEDAGWQPRPDDRWCTDTVSGVERELAQVAWIEGGGTMVKAKFATLHLPIAPQTPSELIDAGSPVPDFARVRLRDARLAATLAGTPGKFTLRGYLVGTISDEDFFGTVVSIRQCARDQLPSSLTGNLPALCAQRDLSQRGDRSAPCDSYSVALKFEAYQVGIGAADDGVTAADAYTYAECAAKVAQETPDAALVVPKCD